MLATINEYLLRVDQWHQRHWRQIKILLFGVLQFGTGIILHSADRTRGTPLIIEQSGIVSVEAFAVIIGVAGLLTLLYAVAFMQRVNAAKLTILSLPFVGYIVATIHGALSGQQSPQGAFIYFMLYLIFLNGIKGSDYPKDGR